MRNICETNYRERLIYGNFQVGNLIWNPMTKAMAAIHVGNPIRCIQLGMILYQVFLVEFLGGLLLGLTTTLALWWCICSVHMIAAMCSLGCRVWSVEYTCWCAQCWVCNTVLLWACMAFVCIHWKSVFRFVDPIRFVWGFRLIWLWTVSCVLLPVVPG